MEEKTEKNTATVENDSVPPAGREQEAGEATVGEEVLDPGPDTEEPAAPASPEPSPPPAFEHEASFVQQSAALSQVFAFLQVPSSHLAQSLSQAFALVHLLSLHFAESLSQVSALAEQLALSFEH